MSYVYIYSLYSQHKKVSCYTAANDSFRCALVPKILITLVICIWESCQDLKACLLSLVCGLQNVLIPTFSGVKHFMLVDLRICWRYSFRSAMLVFTVTYNKERTVLSVS